MAISRKCYRIALGALLPSLLVLSFIAAAAGADHPANSAAAAAQSNDSAMPRWSIQRVSDQVKNATALCLDDQGRIYVAETYRLHEGVEDNRNHTYWIMDDLACESVHDRSLVYKKWQDKFPAEDFFTRFSDRVVRLEDRDGDGQAETIQEFASGFDQDVAGPAIGLLAGDQGIYLTCVPHLWLLRDPDGDGHAEVRVSLQDGFGVKTSLSGHDLHGLVWGPDGKLYFSMGDRGFHCVTREGRVLKDTNSGAVFRCNPDGSEMEVFYHQLRNPQDLAFNQYGDLFTVDNNCDQGDSARICYLLEGGSSGWHLGAQAQTTYEAHIDDGGLDQSPHWLAEGLWKLRFHEQPAHILPPIAHLTNGPSGLAFNSGVGFPNRYQQHFLVCDYKGAPNLCFLYSFRVTRNAAGYSAVDEHIVRGGIPVTDVEVGYDGKIYVSDFGGGWALSGKGNVFALYDPETVSRPEVADLTAIFRAGFHQRTDGELIELLSHQDMRVRLRCQYALVARGDQVVLSLADTARRATNALARYHAIWGLGQLRATAPLLECLADEDDEIRAQAARTLGNVADPTTAGPLRRLLTDATPRVRTFAAIALGKMRDESAFSSVLQLIEQNDDRDAYERHAGVYALQHIASASQLSQLDKHPSRAVRLAAVLALRRQRDPAIGDYLADPDEWIVAEVIRAINDEAIDQALPQLTTHAARWTSPDAPSPPNEMLFRRMINACVRSGQTDDAVTLVQLAANESLPPLYRVLALRVLALVDTPPPIDATLGIYRPLPRRNGAAIRERIEVPLRALFDRATGDLAAEAIQAMNHYGLRLDDDSLVRRVRDGRQPVAVRQTALQQLFDERRFDQKVLLKSLLVDESPALRATATRAYVAAFPHEASGVLRNLLTLGTDADYRTTYDLLADQTTHEAGDILVEQLDQLLRGDLYRTVHLDLYEAAQRSRHPQVRAKLNELEATLAEQGRTPDDFVREGGDPHKGRLVFQNQGVCLKCHRGERGGGDAGPELTNIGRLRRSDELLESVVDPNANVVPGYGTLTVYLDDGTTASGTPLEESDKQLVLKSATGEIQRIEPSRIEDRTELTSPMPKPTETLSRQELRDLMAFLLQLDGRLP
jgi:quinoprotein glucose dehydrogenase